MGVTVPKETPKLKKDSITIAMSGMIGAGKTTLALLYARAFNGRVYEEPVTNNQLLEDYYANKSRYAFELQMELLGTRYQSIRDAMLLGGINILDRSIYEDLLFSSVNTSMGYMTTRQYSIYEHVLHNMLNELEGYEESYGKKAPDLLVYLDMNFENTLDRIAGRGRDWEQAVSDEDYKYFKELQSKYRGWYDSYNSSPKILLDANDLDYEHNQADADLVINKATDKLKELGLIELG